MNWLDYSLFLVVGISTVIAAMRGFLREVVSLFAWVAAFTAASRLSRLAEPLITPHISNPALVGMIAFGLVFIATLATVWIFGIFLKAMASSAGLSSVDRGLGMLFGMLRGILIILVGFMIFLALEMNTPQSMRASLLAPYAIAGAGVLGKALPEGSAMVKRIQASHKQFETMGNQASEASNLLERAQALKAGTKGASGKSDNAKAASEPAPSMNDIKQLENLMQQLSKEQK